MQYDLDTGSHTVYALQYHFVTVTKYRADILTDRVRDRFGEIAHSVAEQYDCSVSDINGESDHVHVLFSAEPTTDLTTLINALKGVSSRRLRQEFPPVKRGLRTALWQPGYFLATTGQVNIDDLKEYVEQQ